MKGYGWGIGVCRGYGVRSRGWGGRILTSQD